MPIKCFHKTILGEIDSIDIGPCNIIHIFLHSGYGSGRVKKKPQTESIQPRLEHILSYIH